MVKNSLKINLSDFKLLMHLLSKMTILILLIIAALVLTHLFHIMGQFDGLERTRSLLLELGNL